MSNHQLVSPLVFCYPIGVTLADQPGVVGEEDVDPKMAMMGEPIVGMDRVFTMNPLVMEHCLLDP